MQDADLHEGSDFIFVKASRSRTLCAGVIGNLRKRVIEYKDGHDRESADYWRALDRMNA
jgi:hypothetical protein